MCFKGFCSCVCRLILFLFALSEMSLSYAADSECQCEGEKNGYFFSPDSFRFDNDLFHPTNDDQNYTYGMAWGWGNDKARSHIFHTETIQAAVLNSMDLKGYHDEYAFQLGVTNFTPDNLSEDAVVYNDRPYANLLYVSSDVVKVSDDWKRSVGVRTTFGFLGTTLGGAAQSAWHTLLRELFRKDEPVHPNGWRHQVGDGGELTAKIDLLYNERLPVLSSYVDHAFMTDLSIGYYTYLNVAYMVKFGRVFSDISPQHLRGVSNPMAGNVKRFGALQNEIGDSYYAKGARSDKPKPYVYKSVDEMYAFLSFGVTRVAYNALLQCQSPSDSGHCLSYEQIEPVMYEWAYGFKFPLWCDSTTNIILSWHGRTAEHKLENSRPHQWGGITIEWNG